MAYLALNNSVSTLASAITTSTQTTITLATGTGALFPAPTSGDYTYVTLESVGGVREIICIVGRSTDVLTVGVPGSAVADAAGRGLEGTTATTWITGTVIEGRATALLIVRAANSKTAAELAASGGAALIGNSPAGTLAGTTVQAALNELDTEKEAVGNKSTSVVTDQASNVKYPSVKAVFDWVTGLFTAKTSVTGSTVLPASTTANRDVSPAVGYLRYNTDLQRYEGYGSAGWGKIGGGTSGGSTDAAVYENDALVTTNYTLGQAGLISGATITIATPGVVTLTGHGFIANQPVFFQTTGALPTGLSVDTRYYVISAGLTADAFQLSLTSGGAAINTSGTQSGVHSCGKIKNGVSAGPFTVNTGAVWTVPTGARHTIV